MSCPQRCEPSAALGDTHSGMLSAMVNKNPFANFAKKKKMLLASVVCVCAKFERFEGHFQNITCYMYVTQKINKNILQN